MVFDFAGANVEWCKLMYMIKTYSTWKTWSWFIIKNLLAYKLCISSWQRLDKTLYVTVKQLSHLCEPCNVDKIELNKNFDHDIILQVGQPALCYQGQDIFQGVCSKHSLYFTLESFATGATFEVFPRLNRFAWQGLITSQCYFPRAPYNRIFPDD